MFKTPFKPTGHYVFDYKPRYYDERKERLEALEQRYKNERSKDNNDDEYQVTLSKNNLKGEWSRTRSNVKADQKSNFRLALIITILAGIALYLLK
ncbi:hypothetical protein [Wenyingzhuangia sp. 2_MG-2023]|uniref:hypothetical protein n=1 Tax=Wenyingzhuangia sp. 2_MG-2023 TaxID=3062639 RepID=UPI0026E45C47|nr:hypothetical protein [Wenyingzhuangia sp. 2_MG-2023]MDO6738298.1 hypothetical protein [Wenyingzhuangia sp. 2_MG-2023]